MNEDILMGDGADVDEWGQPYPSSTPYVPVIYCMVCGNPMTEVNTVDPFVVDCCEDCFAGEGVFF